jgi:hypothetical protein
MRLLLAGALLFVASVGFAADFPPEIAVEDAGSIADPAALQFNAFYIPAGTPPAAVTDDIKKALVVAASAKGSLAIIGPDYALNARILGGILQTAPKDLLKGATILFVNGGEDTEELKKVAAAAGAIFRAAKYSGK